MEVIKSPEGNYHIAANKDEWFLIHFYANFLNANYDKIDETLLDHFGVQKEINEITNKINAAHQPDRNENYLTLNKDEIYLLSHMIDVSFHQFDEEIEDIDPDEKLYNLLYDKVYKHLWKSIFPNSRI